MFNDENENQKSISLVSIIAIILTSLLVVGAIALDIHASLTVSERIGANQQNAVVAQKEDTIKNENANEIDKNKNPQPQQPVQQQKKEEKKQENTVVENKKQENTTQKAEENKNQTQENKAQDPVQVPKPVQPQPETPAPVEASYGKIFLTFDDGPSNATTGRLLDVLKKYNVKATFFVTGNGSDELIKREYNEGHSIGLHTYSHSYKTVYASEEAFFNDLGKVDQRVYNAIGIHPKITRFPGGASNTVSKFNPGIMTRLAKQLKEKGYKYWDWNVSSGDAGDTKDPDKIVQNVTEGCSKDKRNIVLMHDIHEYTVDSIERIIIWAKENNYEFCRIEENMDPVHHRIAN